MGAAIFGVACLVGMGVLLAVLAVLATMFGE